MRKGGMVDQEDMRKYDDFCFRYQALREFDVGEDPDLCVACDSTRVILVKGRA